MPRFLLAGCLLLYVAAAAIAEEPSLPLLFEDDFEQGADQWVVADAHGDEPSWRIVQLDDVPERQHVFRALGTSRYKPPHRSPLNFALLKDVVVTDFELSVEVQNTNVDVGAHRDLCFFWGFQNPAQFYYVHLGAKADPNSCQIFVVDKAPRTPITVKESPGIPWTDGWHDVKVKRDVESGLVEVFFDDMETPVMTANDNRFTWGRVGIGTFDDHGNFDAFRLWGEAVTPVPDEARLPGEE